MDTSEPTNTTETPTSVFRFLDLPDELKVKILSYRLVVDKSRSISPLVHNMMAQNALLPLALTSKKMYGLAMELYYENNTFRAEATRSIGNLWRSRFAYPNPVVAPRIRKLIVKLEVLQIAYQGVLGIPGVTLDYVLQTGGGWRHLLRFKDAPPPQREPPYSRARAGGLEERPYAWSKESTRWQEYFDLQEFKIELVLVDYEAAHGNWRLDTSNTAPTIPNEQFRNGGIDVREGRIAIKAKQVEIEIKGHKHDLNHPEALCIEKDAQVDEQAIRDLVQNAMQ